MSRTVVGGLGTIFPLTTQNPYAHSHPSPLWALPEVLRAVVLSAVLLGSLPTGSQALWLLQLLSFRAYFSVLHASPHRNSATILGPRESEISR